MYYSQIPPRFLQLLLEYKKNSHRRILSSFLLFLLISSYFSCSLYLAICSHTCAMTGFSFIIILVLSLLASSAIPSDAPKIATKNERTVWIRKTS